MTTQTCDGCQYFDRSPYFDVSNTGTCNKAGEYHDPDNLPADGFMSHTDEYTSFTYVGPKFGCIHWLSRV